MIVPRFSGISTSMQTPIIDVLNDRETKLKELEKVAELYQAQWKELERI